MMPPIARMAVGITPARPYFTFCVRDHVKYVQNELDLVLPP